MAVVNIPDKSIRLIGIQAITDYLATIGLDYEHWEIVNDAVADASDEEILDVYSNEIEKLKAKGGYVTADIINVTPATPGLDEMLNKFNKEHWHDEDEVRFIVKGHGLFHIVPNLAQCGTVRDP